MRIDFYLTNYGFANDDLFHYLHGLAKFVAEVGSVAYYDSEIQELSNKEKKQMDEDIKIRVSENCFFVCEEVLLRQFNEKPLFEWCYDSEIPDELRTALNIVLQSAHNKTDVTISVSNENFTSLKNKLRNNSETSASALLGMEKSLVGLTRYGVVFDVRSWLQLRYRYWCCYIENPDHYKTQCLLYFFNLLFADTAFDTMDYIFPDCRTQVTRALKSLDETYYNYLQQHGNINKPNNEKMNWLGAASGQEVSPEGSGGADRINANIEFVKDGGGTQKVFCYNHFKFYYDDNHENFSQNRRLYFHDPLNDIGHCRKVLIGHIGVHL